MRVSEIDDRHCGEYKTVENNVAAFDRDGHQLGVVFETASAFETPRCMEELIEWTNLQLARKKLPPLIIIGMFIVAFLSLVEWLKNEKSWNECRKNCSGVAYL